MVRKSKLFNSRPLKPSDSEKQEISSGNPMYSHQNKDGAPPSKHSKDMAKKARKPSRIRGEAKQKSSKRPGKGSITRKLAKHTNRAIQLSLPRRLKLQRSAKKNFKFHSHPSYNNVIEFILKLKSGGVPEIPFDRASLVWFPHPKDGYVPGKVLESFTPNSIGHMVIIEDDEAKPVYVSKKQSRNLMCMDPQSVRPLENLDGLFHLNEAALLYNLKLRYRKGSPFCIIGTPKKENEKRASGTFSDGTIILLNTFKEPTMDTRVYIRRVCYNIVSNMISTRRHQVLFFSGESSSGKTHFSREFIYQLAMQRRKHRDNNLKLLEVVKGLYGTFDAFLSARTLRNRKSTRGAKAVELLHTLGSGRVVGGHAAMFFLDKTRVASRRKGEENFAVLYQVSAHAEAEEAFKEKIGLLGSRKMLRYLDNKHQDDEKKENLTREERHDNARWIRLVGQLKNCFGLTEDNIEMLGQVLATVLNVGNIDFVGEEAAEDYEIRPEDGISKNETLAIANQDVVERVANQLGIHQDMLEHSLMVKDIKAGEDVLMRTLTVQQSEMVRDAIAKYLYERIMCWLQARINRSMAPPKTAQYLSEFYEKVGAVKLFDLVGFEAFEKSSFEHLCINYYNEGLNMHYQSFVARMEQQRVIDCTRDAMPIEQQRSLFSVDAVRKGLQSIGMAGQRFAGVRKSRSQEPDDGVFTLFTHRRIRGRLGVFDVINEVGRLKDVGTDNKILIKMQTEFPSDSQYIRRPKQNIEKFKDCFSVVHYAGLVNYDVSGFLSKNYNALPVDLEAAMWNSSNANIRALCMLTLGGPGDYAQEVEDPWMNGQLFDHPEEWRPIWCTLNPKVGRLFTATLSSKIPHFAADDAASIASFSSFKTIDTHGANDISFKWEKKVVAGAEKAPEDGEEAVVAANQIEVLDGETETEQTRDHSLSTVDENMVKESSANVEPSVESNSASMLRKKSIRFGKSSVSELMKTFDKKPSVQDVPIVGRTGPSSSAGSSAGSFGSKSSFHSEPMEEIVPKVKIKRKEPVSIKKLTNSFRFFPPPRSTHQSTLNQLLSEYGQLIKSVDLHRNASLVSSSKLRSTASFARTRGHDVRFVKCIKSNSMRVPGFFDDRAVLTQLRKTGLVDMCEVRQAIGYPVQLDFISFMHRYCVFMPSVLRRAIRSREDAVKSIKDLCSNMEHMKLMNDDGKGNRYAIGASMVLLKYDTYRLVETAKQHALVDLSIFLQKYCRTFVYRTRFLRMMKIKIEVELESATDARSIELLNKWMTSAKRYKVFTLPYYQAIGRLERLYKEKDVRKQLMKAVEARDNIMLYNALTAARELDMTSLSFPEVNLALKCQHELEEENREEVEMLLEEYKKDYKSVLNQLGDTLEDKKRREQFEAFKDEEDEYFAEKEEQEEKNSKRKKEKGKKAAKRRQRRRSNESKKLPGIRLDKEFLKKFYIAVGSNEKVQEIDFILKYFKGRPDDLIQVLESKYDIKFRKDGTFKRARNESVSEFESSSPTEMMEMRKSMFVKDLATAKGLPHQSVRLHFSPVVSKEAAEKALAEEAAAAESDDEDSIKVADFEDERWGKEGNRDSVTDSVESA